MSWSLTRTIAVCKLCLSGRIISIKKTSDRLLTILFALALAEGSLIQINFAPGFSAIINFRFIMQIMG